MKLTKEQEKGQEYFKTIITKAWNDSKFKQELISNPVAGIEKATGEKIVLGDSARIVVEDQTNPSIVYLNIPRNLDNDNLELTDEQLELVAGGEFLLIGGILVGLAVGAVAAGAGYLIYQAVK